MNMMTSRLFRLSIRVLSNFPKALYVTKRKLVISSIVGAVGPVVFKDDPLESFEKAGDAAKLTHMYLIKNASLACIDSASSLLTQTTSNLLELEEKYTEALNKLAQIFTLSLEDLDNEHRQVACWDAVVQVRSQVADLRRQRQDMESMMHSAERMLHAAAEAALTAGAEYGSTVAGERIFSAQSRLRGLQDKRTEAEAHLAIVEAKYIHEISEHHKQKQKTGQNPRKIQDGGDKPEVFEQEPEVERDTSNISTDDSREHIKYDFEKETFEEELNFGEENR